MNELRAIWPRRSPGRRTRLRQVRWQVLIAIPVIVGTSGSSPSASAAPAGAVLEIEAALTTEYGFNDSVVVSATVKADSLIDGEITATADLSSTTVVTPLQVAGGAEAKVFMVVPMPGFNNGNTSVTVVLRDGKEIVSEEKITFSHRADVDVTGVLPQLRASLAQLPNRVQLEPDVRGSQFAGLDPEVAAMGPAALSQLDTIAGSSSDLANLEPTARDSLLSWLNSGGRLLIDDDADLTALPPQWRPTDVGYATAGLGEVRLSAGKAAAGKWKEILLPAELDSFDSPFGFGNEMFADPQASLARRAGVTPPSLSPILIALGIYVVVVGPVLYLVLRAMRRLTLAWLVIPALAALVAGAVVVTGGAWRRGGDPVANVARQTYPGGSVVHSETLLFNRRGGETTVAAPAGWTAADATMFFGEDPSTVAKRRLVTGDSATTLTTTLEPGQVTVLRANGTSAGESLSVSATATGRRTIEGTVTNLSDRPLSAVALFASGEVKLVGDLAAGASTPFKLEDIDAAMIGQVSLADQVWVDPAINFGNPFGPGFSTEPTQQNVGGRVRADLGLWSSFSATAGQGLYPSGIVRAVGWRFEQPSELSSSGVVTSTELVSAIAPVAVGDGKVERVAVRSMMISSPFDGNNNGQQVSLLRVPPEATKRQLQVVVPRGTGDVELWNGTKWVTIKPDKEPLPQAIVAGGVVMLRINIGFNNGPVNSGSIALEEVR